MRDIQTVLSAGLGLNIDHRVVSIVRSSAPAQEPVLAAAAAAAAPVAAALLEPEAEHGPTLAEVTELPVRDQRIRFESVNLFVSGARTQAQVELRWRGTASNRQRVGLEQRDESHRLVAEATAAAVQEFVDDPVALGVTSVEFVDLAKSRVIVVSLTLLAHRQEKLLTGSCVVEQDTPQAVVLATLAALNRVVGGLRVKEPTEYVLRPTTTETEFAAAIVPRIMTRRPAEGREERSVAAESEADPSVWDSRFPSQNPTWRRWV